MGWMFLQWKNFNSLLLRPFEFNHFFIYFSIICVCSSDELQNDYRLLDLTDFILKPETESRHAFMELKEIYNVGNLIAFPSHSSVFLSALDHVLRVNYETMNVKDSIKLHDNSHSALSCLSLMPSPASWTPPSCNHYIIKVFLLHHDEDPSTEAAMSPDRLIICTTFMKNATCMERSAMQLSKMYRSWHSWMAPLHPDKTVSALMGTDGNFYLGTFVDSAGKDPAIIRVPLKENSGMQPLRSFFYGNKEDVTFIHSFQSGKQLFFLLRELSWEHDIACARKMYVPRLVRVCLNDGIGQQIREWSTLSKVNIHCPANYFDKNQFLYSELTSAVVDEERGLLIGLFTTPRDGPRASAICQFSLKRIEEILFGPFLHFTDGQWKASPYNNNINCSLSSQSSRFPTVSTIMYHPLLPQTKFADIAANQSWTHFAVDEVPRNKEQTIIVYFVATADGNILKIHRLGDKQCLVEQIDVTPGVDTSITDMKLLSKESILIVTTNNSIARVATERCVRLANKQLCEYAQDPYCSWDTDKESCESILNSNDSESIKPDPLTIHSCPQISNQHYMNIVVDGGWSMWTSWSACEFLKDTQSLSNGKSRQQDRKQICQCRQRFCNQPAPIGQGARPCIGHGQETNACIIESTWSQWSSWSGCSKSCGKGGWKVRRRVCSNISLQWPTKIPASYIKLNGNDAINCSGPSMERQLCEEIPECGVLSTSLWNSWSSWSNCSVQCNAGIRQRVRVCYQVANSPPCPGQNKQKEICNVQSCPNMKTTSSWTKWVITVRNTDGSTQERRYRGHCNTSTPENAFGLSHLPLSSMFLAFGNAVLTDTQTRVVPCSTGRHCIQKSVNPFSLYTSWSEWSSCSYGCTSASGSNYIHDESNENEFKEQKSSRKFLGFQNRTRICPLSSERASCHALPQQLFEIRACPNYQCVVSWSCWSSWSQCSQSCGTGMQLRHRKCLNEEKQIAMGCPSLGAENRPCEVNECPVKNGWSKWLDWSSCTSLGNRYRVRLCNIQGKTLPMSSETQLTSNGKADSSLSVISNATENGLCPGRWRERVLCGKEDYPVREGGFGTHQFPLVILIVVAICSFVVGCGLVLVIYVVLQHLCATRVPVAVITSTGDGGGISIIDARSLPDGTLMLSARGDGTDEYNIICDSVDDVALTLSRAGSRRARHASESSCNSSGSGSLGGNRPYDGPPPPYTRRRVGYLGPSCSLPRISARKLSFGGSGAINKQMGSMLLSNQTSYENLPLTAPYSSIPFQASTTSRLLNRPLNSQSSKPSEMTQSNYTASLQRRRRYPPPLPPIRSISLPPNDIEEGVSSEVKAMPEMSTFQMPLPSSKGDNSEDVASSSNASSKVVTRPRRQISPSTAGIYDNHPILLNRLSEETISMSNVNLPQT